MTSERYFPFTRLGYRCNPFRVATKEEFGVLGVLPEKVRCLSDDPARHLQLLGERGRGKTSILLRLLSHFQRKGLDAAYEYLAPGQRVPTTDLDDLNLFLLDEFQRLNRRARMRLLQRACGRDRAGLRLIISSHTDASTAFRRYNKTLETVRLSSLGKDHARKVIERRLAFFALRDVPAVRMTDEAYKLLWQHYGNDLRALEAALYEVFQQLLDEEAPFEGPLLEAVRAVMALEAQG
jgi:hypothetical protein